MKPFTTTLAMLQGGALLDDCTEAFGALVRGVEETGKAGKLTITIDLKKSSGAIEVASKVTTKTPEPKPDADILWATVDGNLVPDNPAQRKLDLKGVEQVKDLRAG